MITSRAIYGLNAIGIVASAKRHRPVTVSRLAAMMGVSESYTENVMKVLKGADLLRSHRGPGGGYQLQQAVINLSVWDVVSCFISKRADIKQIDSTPEFTAAFELHQKIINIKRSFLKAYPLVDVLKHLPASFRDSYFHTSSMSSHFKPMPKQVLPSAPNSVFDLSNFM